MSDRKELILLSRNNEDYKLLIKLTKTFGYLENKGLDLDNLIDSTSFSIDEKKALRDIFNEEYESILTKDFVFFREADQWHFKNHDYLHGYTVKILFRMNNETEYEYNSVVSGSDLNLVVNLIEQYNRILEVDLLKEIGEAVDGYKINTEMIDFISMYLQNNSEDSSHMDYAFTRIFIDAIQEYDDLLFDNFDED